MELLFDLDGTLTDSGVGITACLQHALGQLGRPSPPVSQLRRFVGPPLRDSFAALLSTEDQELLELAVSHYRQRFVEVGMYENEMYADVPTGLAALRRSEHRLWVVTSKPMVYARRIIDHFGLAPYFEEVYGSELSGERFDKGDLIAHVLRREQLSAERVWMIGDRAEDVAGGKQNGTRTAGVLWGYGSAQELRAAQPDVLADDMMGLCEALTALEPGATSSR